MLRPDGGGRRWPSCNALRSAARSLRTSTDSTGSGIISGMTPDGHAVRAAELAAEAEDLYSDLRHDVESGGKVDDALWRFLDTTIRLGQLHAALTRETPDRRPSTALP